MRYIRLGLWNQISPLLKDLTTSLRLQSESSESLWSLDKLELDRLASDR